MDIHRLLNRQISKYLSEEIQQKPEIIDFIKKIRSSYQALYDDKLLSDHAFKIVESEYMASIADQKAQNELMSESVHKIKKVASRLYASESAESGDTDLSGVINYLEDQARKTKQLEQDILQARDDAEKASMAKSEFLSIMSHEIRTPLNVIIGIAHILRQEEHLSRQEDSIKMLSIASTNLLNLVNDILDFNKIEEGKVKLNYEAFNLKEFLLDVKGAGKYLAWEKGNAVELRIDPNIPDYVVGERSRLNQVLNNLVFNAIKFTDNGTILIEAELEKLDKVECHVLFTVTDTGIGIATEKQKEIFNRFFQINGKGSEASSGSGLGLTITQKLLNLMGSDIHLESTLGNGAKFYFSITFNTTDRFPENAQPYQEKSSLKGVKILLVEDVEFNIVIAKTLLEKKEAIVAVARNGQEAIDAFIADTFDVVLMDLRMPIMDGHEASVEIKKIAPEIPILALTASVSSGVKDHVLLGGVMNGFIGKPFRPEQLYREIAKVIR